MLRTVLIAATCIVVASLYRKILACRRNYKIARSTGFATFYSPVHITDIWWLALYPSLAPLLKKLPGQDPWLPLSMVWSIWKAGYEPFQKIGHDSILLACPKGNILWTCDPVIVKELWTNHNIQVPVDLVRFHDIWGPTIASVEGEEWKRHRKVVTYGMNPSSLPIVWKNSIYQTETLIERLTEDRLVLSIPKIWMSRLSLHVIAGIFFDTTLDWKEYTRDTRPSPGKEGYQSSFETAMFTILAHLGLLFMVPRWLLGLLPFRSFRETHIAFTDFTNYMLERRAEVLNRLEEVKAKRVKTLLESVVIAGDSDTEPLAKESVLGNIFFTMMAGHETTGNTLGFALLLLAVHPECQKEVQRELDRVLGDRATSEWTLDHDYHALQKGYVGAVLKETLRLYHPVQFVWRTNVAQTTLHDSKGVQHVVPANTIFCIDFAAAFQNPSTWAPSDISTKRRSELHGSRAVDFDPERWLRDGAESEQADIPLHWPFGQGPRTCPGKPLAQVEMVALLATVLKDYRMELVVDDGVKAECKGDDRAAWSRTRDEAFRRLEDGVEANLTLAMMKELPIRLVKRTG